MSIVGILIVALYAAIATSTSWVRICQENEKVTQIMSEKLDTLRLYNWDQLTASNGFIQTNFVVGIDPTQTNSTPYYTGRLFIVKNPVTEPYQSNLLRVTVQVKWVSGLRPQVRSNTTFVAQYGLNSYVVR